MKKVYLSIIFYLVVCTTCFGQNNTYMPTSKSELVRTENKAQQGDINSMYDAGCAYLYGVPGVVKSNEKKGINYMQQAADRSHPDACRKLYQYDAIKYAAYKKKAETIYVSRATGEDIYHVAELYNNSLKDFRGWLKAAVEKGYVPAESYMRKMWVTSKTSYSYEEWVASIPSKISVSQIESHANNDAPEICDIDFDIPVNPNTNHNAVALVIGNEMYSNSNVSDVPYAKRDAEMFKNYCINTLGLDERNVLYRENATLGEMSDVIDRLKVLVTSQTDIYFYYAGHGAPNPKDKTAYLIPSDANGKNFGVCYSLEDLQTDLSEMGAASVTMFLDACFTGNNRDVSMIEGERPAAILPSTVVPKSKMIVFSATKDNETAQAYHEKRHGIFTYYLLKNLKESKGNITLGELGNAVRNNVINHTKYSKVQTPTVSPSSDMSGTWMDKRL